MQRWLDFQKTTIVPAFRKLRARKIFASVRNLECCQTCAHYSLSEHHTSYLFYHMQNKDGCIETPLSQRLELYLGYHFETKDIEECALAILKKHFRVKWNGDHGKRICISPKMSPSENWGVLRSFVQKRSIAVYWQAETAHLYASGGVGRKRDRDIFEEDMTELGFMNDKI